MAAAATEEVLDLESQSAEQTRQFGARLGEIARAGDVYCLEGDLGSGKTCWVQGLGQGLGIPQPIHSPTFILANEYRTGRLPLFHVDVYRVSGVDEAIGFGLEDYLNAEGVCVIEWAERIREALPSERLWIAFRHLGESQRGLLMQANGDHYRMLLEEFRRGLLGFADAARH